VPKDEQQETLIGAHASIISRNNGVLERPGEEGEGSNQETGLHG
jgi:hypothetical protein